MIDNGVRRAASHHDLKGRIHMPEIKGPFDNALQPTASAKTPVKPQVAEKPANRLNKRIQEPALPVGQGEDALYVGIDLGTSRTSVSASNGQRHTVLSWVGYPKDIIARKRVGTKTVIGQEALDNRLALDMIKPLETGAINWWTASTIGGTMLVQAVWSASVMSYSPGRPFSVSVTTQCRCGSLTNPYFSFISRTMCCVSCTFSYRFWISSSSRLSTESPPAAIVT